MNSGGGGMVPQYGDMDDELGINMPSMGSSHTLAKPIPMKRLSEKRIEQARASLGNVSSMTTGSYENCNYDDMSGLPAIDATFGMFNYYT